MQQNTSTGASRYKKLRWTVFTISVGLFLLSLTQDCFCTENGCTDSILALSTGWFAMFLLGSGIVWLANPFLLLSWLVKPKIALVSSLIALIFGMSFLLFNDVVQNEAGTAYHITSYKAGYWLWTMSMLASFIGNILLFKNDYLKDNYED